MKIGLALGCGGNKGFVPVWMLEAFDELGIRPARVVGTSIRAVMGA
jgi:NTE family protein